jgi:hypothetical protein
LPILRDPSFHTLKSSFYSGAITVDEIAKAVACPLIRCERCPGTGSERELWH